MHKPDLTLCMLVKTGTHTDRISQCPPGPVRHVPSSTPLFLNTMVVTQLTYVACWRKWRWVQFVLHHSLRGPVKSVLPHSTAVVQRQARQVIGEEAAGGQIAMSVQTAVDCSVFLHSKCLQSNSARYQLSKRKEKRGVTYKWLLSTAWVSIVNAWEFMFNLMTTLLNTDTVCEISA